MSWIESHQSLLTHRKTLRASAQLKISRYLLIGHLHAFWWWALDNAGDDGDLGLMSDAEIAEAAGWPIKKAQQFVSALTRAGFLDETPDGYCLHNWYRYAGKLNAKRAKDRQRKGDFPNTSPGVPAPLAASSSGIPPEIAGTNLPTNQPTLTNQPTNPEKAPKPSAGALSAELPEGFKYNLNPPRPDEPGFIGEYVRQVERRTGRPPSPSSLGDAAQLERDFGTDACIQAAKDVDWSKPPNWLRAKLQSRRDQQQRAPPQQHQDFSVEVIST